MTDTIGEAARACNVLLVVGVIERDGGILYCTALMFDRKGKRRGKHRKLMPTAMERLVWGFGDGSTLTVVESEVGRIGAVTCWENYMPMVRMAMYSQNIQIYRAPTADDRDTWLPSMRHVALEGRCFVLSACQYLKRGDCPADCPAIHGHDPDTVLMRDASCIIGPLGQILAAPDFTGECIRIAELDPAQIALGEYDFDIRGHNARPDVFELRVNRRPMQAVIDDA
jgi:nitrilase